jgi:DNA-binding NarL/FixJ family response regulator
MVAAYVSGAGTRVSTLVSAWLHQTGIALVPAPGPDSVFIATGRTVDEALTTVDTSGHRTMVVADTVTRACLEQAVRSGVRVLLQSTPRGPEQLAAAVRAAWHGDTWLPYDLLVRALGVARAPSRPEPDVPSVRLTAREAAVLSLSADGYGNAAIARSLACSEHTVKNVIYDLMARLQVRNRAHAVARGVRAGLI